MEVVVGGGVDGGSEVEGGGCEVGGSRVVVPGGSLVGVEGGSLSTQISGRIVSDGFAIRTKYLAVQMGNRSHRCCPEHLMEKRSPAWAKRLILDENPQPSENKTCHKDGSISCGNRSRRLGQIELSRECVVRVGQSLAFWAGRLANAHGLG